MRFVHWPGPAAWPSPSSSRWRLASAPTPRSSASSGASCSRLSSTTTRSGSIYIRQSAPGAGSENVNFSVPEINDLKSGIKSITALGDFSTIEFTLVGLGEPRVVRAGVVSGSFFPVMGLQPIRGRLVDATDDGPQAASVTVLTHRFWTESLNSDETILGKQIKLGDRASTIIGVLEPSVPYPTETQLIANVVTSSHHMSATMQDGRVHRMTELFGRLKAEASLEQAVAELRAIHGGMLAGHREAYPVKDDYRINAVRLRDQITSPARTILLVLLAASGLIFVIACSNVANLILARSVRREGELAVRAALGASRAALRRTLLAESVLLCVAGALLGVLIARPMLSVIARYASRYSVRALDLTVDSTLLWVGVSLALISSVLLAFIPRLPSADAAAGLGLSSGSVRITTGTNRRLRLFAVTQIAASFVLLAGAGALLTTLIALQQTQDRPEPEQRAGGARAPQLRASAGADTAALSRSDSQDRRAARSGTSRHRHHRPVA